VFSQVQLAYCRLFVDDPLCSIIPGEIMALTIGTQLGSHEITAFLGKGGIGEMYRARDLKLQREVAPGQKSRFSLTTELLSEGRHL
jgi:hypothetical protein